MPWTALALALAGLLPADDDPALTLDWELGLERWKDRFLEAVHRAGPVLLVADSEHDLTALDPATGAPLWLLPLARPLLFGPTLSDDRLTLCAGSSGSS